MSFQATDQSSPTPADQSWLTVNESAQEANLCDATILRRIRDGQLQARKIGNTWRIRRDWLSFYLENPKPRSISAEAREAQRVRNRKAAQARWAKRERAS